MVVRYKSWLAIGVIGLLFLSGSSVQSQGPAQPPGGGRGGAQFFGGFGGGGGGGDLQLLNREEVQQHLELVESQKDEIRSIGEGFQEKMRDMFSGMGNLSQEERTARFQDLQKKMTEMGDELKGKVSKVLLPHQKKRFDEIVAQQRIKRSQFGLPGGQTGGINPDVLADELKLNDDEKERLKTKAEELRKDIEKRIADMRKDAEKKLLNMLTREQQDAYKQLVGESFDLPPQGFGGFGGGRGGAGGGGAGGGGRSGGGGRPGAAGRPGGTARPDGGN